MALYHKCDRCGKEIVKETRLSTITMFYKHEEPKTMAKHGTYDLCKRCMVDFEKYMAGYPHD